MFVHLVVDRTGSRPAVILPSSPKQQLPKTIEYAGQSTPVSWSGRDKFVNSSTVRASPTNVPICQVSESLRRSLKLPHEAKLHCRVHGDTWVLGPCLGIYLSIASSARPFGEQTGLVTDLAQRASDMGLDLVLLPPGFTRDGTGYRYDSHEQEWRRSDAPTPDIVIRRSGAFTREQSQDVIMDLAAFAAAGRLHTLPRNFSNKWNLYQLLNTHRKIAPFLPHTTLAKSATEVYQQAVKRADVYVKPLTGARGISVFHLVWHDRRLTVEWEATPATTGSRRLRRRKFPSLALFQQFWRGVRLKQCIVQDTVPLPKKKDGRPFDFRWLVQYTNEPQVVARVARIGGPQSVTTNIHTGGKPQSAVNLMRQLNWRGTNALIARMDTLAIETAEALRKAYGPYAELGVDLAVTDDHELCLFEVNPTPGRRMLRNIDATTRELSLDYLLEYAIRAAGFAKE